MRYILSYVLCGALLFLPSCQVLEALGWVNKGVVKTAHAISNADKDKDGSLSLGELLGIFGIGAGGITVTTRNLVSTRKKKKTFGSMEERLAAIEKLLEKSEEEKV